MSDEEVYREIDKIIDFYITKAPDRLDNIVYEDEPPLYEDDLPKTRVSRRLYEIVNSELRAAILRAVLEDFLTLRVEAESDAVKLVSEWMFDRNIGTETDDPHTFKYEMSWEDFFETLYDSLEATEDDAQSVALPTLQEFAVELEKLGKLFTAAMGRITEALKEVHEQIRKVEEEEPKNDPRA